MRGNEIILRCFAEQKDGYWQAFCIDLCLGVQGESEAEVKQKLEAQAYEYLKDIFEGEDRPYAKQLLSRKAPASIRAKYHFYAFMGHIHALKNRFAFDALMPFKMA